MPRWQLLNLDHGYLLPVRIEHSALSAVYYGAGWSVIHQRLDWRLDSAAGYSTPRILAWAMACVRFFTPNLPINVIDVGLDRDERNDEPVRDVLVGQAGGEESQHF